MKTANIIFISAILAAYACLAPAGEKHVENHEEKHLEEDKHPASDHHNQHQPTVTLKNTVAEHQGIALAQAASGSINQQVTLYGQLQSGPEQISHVRARFTGLIKSVLLTVGNTVKKGDLLANIESNDSLQNYPLLAPIDGVIIQRHANAGEFTQDQILFSIAQLDNLWAELQLFSGKAGQVKTGQTVTINGLDNPATEITSTIEHIVPALNAPYQIARVPLSRVANSLYAGLWVTARISTNSQPAEVIIDQRALHTIDGKVGIFTAKPEGEATIYTFTEVTLGLQDDGFASVTNGITAGTQYAVENSYILKADVEKSSAEHAH
ncbi:efflux RND transporter periplasmic adaptor subunit [Halioxenophilus aromaticivorans]